MAADLAVVMGVPEAHRVGGYERQAFRLAAALERYGVAVRAVTHQLAAVPPRAGRAASVPLDVLPVPEGRGGRTALACARYLLRRRRRHRRLVVHCHALAGFSLTLAYAAQKLGLATVIKVATAGDIDRFWNSPFADRAVHRFGPRLRDVLARCGAIVTLNALSEDEARRHLGRIPSRVLALTNMVDLGDDGGDGAPPAGGRIPAPESAGPETEDPPDPIARALAEARARGRRCALMVNRLEARKNTVRLVRLWCGLPADLKRRWRLVIVGRGEEEVAVLSFLRESGEDSVALLGEQVGHERWLDRADLFILASEREGNPNALMEAAASGIRVLVTDIHGVGDCLPATARGAVFSLGDPRDLESVGRERLSACLEAIDLGSAAPGSGGGREATAPLRAAAGSLFGPEMVCGRYLWLYERLLAGPRPGVIRS